MDVRAFDFFLPSDLIAQEPAAERSHARLLVLHRDTGAVVHAAVSSLVERLRPGDLVVVNNTRVFPARLVGRRVPSGGAVECLLIRRLADAAEAYPRTGGSETRGVERWEALVHPGPKLKPGAEVIFSGPCPIGGRVLDRHFYGRRTIELWTTDGSSVDAAIEASGHVPLPPYIKRADRPDDRERYQTVFARARGSVAAPTAGLHLTRALLSDLERRGVEVAEITLHVGYGTFQPMRVDRVEDHRLEPERYEIGIGAADAINRALNEGRRVVAVGTTTTRTLEAVARAHGSRISPGSGETDLFIYPGFEFRVVGALLTNFHLPQSSLLMLVSAFAGRERVLSAYDAAVAARYRFYSYGDAMLVV